MDIEKRHLDSLRDNEAEIKYISNKLRGSGLYDDLLGTNYFSVLFYDFGSVYVWTHYDGQRNGIFKETKGSKDLS
jgi:hypothetical protein